MNFIQFVNGTWKIKEQNSDIIKQYIYSFINQNQTPQLEPPNRIFTEQIEEAIQEEDCYYLWKYYLEIKNLYTSDVTLYNIDHPEEEDENVILQDKGLYLLYACEKLNAFYISFMKYIPREELKRVHDKYLFYHIPTEVKDVFIED